MLMMISLVDKVEILVLVDNKTDSLSSIPASIPPGQVTLEWQNLVAAGMKEVTGSCQCCANHGLSLLIKATTGETSKVVMFDAGPVDFAVEYNGERLGVKFGEVDAFMLSHGHWDHAGGLLKAVDLILSSRPESNPHLPCYLHPDMFRRRGVSKPNGQILPLGPVPTAAEIAAHGATPVLDDKPLAVLSNTFYVSGEIKRQTEFEKGFVGHLRRNKEDTDWEPDPLIMDERYLAVNVKGKGLVIFSACSHAGIVNVMKSAREEFGSDVPIHAVLGGFHLSGHGNEDIIEETVAGFEEFSPDLIVPGHCTGWRAVHSLVGKYGDKVLPMAVGMSIVI